MSGAREYLVAGSICFVVFLLIYGLTGRGALQTSDEVAVFRSGISVAIDGDLAIDELRWLQERMNIGTDGPDGHLYTKFFPGNVFSVALVYKLTARSNDQPYRGPYGGIMEFAPSVTGARWAMKLDALWGALGMTALLLALRRFFDWRTAILTVVLFGLSSDWWYQSRGLFSEVGAGAFLIASLCFAVHDKPYGSATALALSILFRPTSVLAFPIWGKAVWGKGIKVFASGLIIAAGVLALAAYNWARFGSPLTFGYTGDTFKSSLLQGLSGIFFAPGRSPFVYSPILLLAIPGAWLFYKKQRNLAIICLYVVISHAVTIAAWHRWDGGVSWGSRLITPVTPVLAIFVAAGLEVAWRRKWIGAIALVLALLGVGVQTVAMLRSPMKIIVEDVAPGGIPYEDTIYTVRNSWPALQIRSLKTWQPCDLDAYTLRRVFFNCPQ